MGESLFNRFQVYVVGRVDKGEPTNTLLKYLIVTPIFIGCFITLAMVFVGSYLPYRKDIPKMLEYDL